MILTTHFFFEFDCVQVFVLNNVHTTLCFLLIIRTRVHEFDYDDDTRQACSRLQTGDPPENVAALACGAWRPLLVRLETASSPSCFSGAPPVALPPAMFGVVKWRFVLCRMQVPGCHWRSTGCP